MPGTPVTRNSRDAALFLRPTGAGAYTKVNKSHGLVINTPTKFSDDTGHGQKFDTQLPGTHQFEVSLDLYYQKYADLLHNYSLNETLLDFLVYPSVTSDPLNFWSGSSYLGQEKQDLGLNKTIEESYKLVLAGGDPVWNYAT
jgi:hypothetical protein